MPTQTDLDNFYRAVFDLATKKRATYEGSSFHPPNPANTDSALNAVQPQHYGALVGHNTTVNPGIAQHVPYAYQRSQEPMMSGSLPRYWQELALLELLSQQAQKKGQ